MIQNIQHNDTDNTDIFSEIRPYNDAEFRAKLAEIIREPGFEHAVRYVMPDVDYDDFTAKLLEVETQKDFQVNVMGAFLELLVAKTTKGLSVSGLENYSPDCRHTFITNHRDIVLDASFLNLCFIRSGLPLTQVAIGNNLLIYEWITDLVKINRSFIVKRDTGVRGALDAARQLSAYIHHVITKLNESVWIAQREGRAKDSSDNTQESVIKMLSLEGGETPLNNLAALNIVPVAISYEYDPNDYLKVREFLLKRRDPEFRKSKRDDLFSMETGLLQQKGRVHFHIGKCINEALKAALPADASRADAVREVCGMVDRSIHCGYRIFPCNYIAYDEIHGTSDYASEYSAADVEAFNAYISAQLDRVEVSDVTPEEREYMRSMMLTMYANPLKNQLAARDCENCD